MRIKGRFNGMSRDLEGRLIMSFRVYDEKNALKQVDGIREEGTLAITAEKPKKKRSLSANAYYWALVGQLAGALNISNIRMHNLLLRRYGAIATIDEEPLITFLPDTEEAEKQALDAEKYHVRPTTALKTFKDGSGRRMYYILKGSSQYDSKEMSRLLNGLIDECNQMGIPTATPEEVEEMLKAYGKHHTERT